MSERETAIAALTCGYYNDGPGLCTLGCYEEPICCAEEPEGGWQLPTPYGQGLIDKARAEAEAEQERQRVQSWLDAEKAWLERPILESRMSGSYAGIPRDIPNGVYPLNPLCAAYVKNGARFIYVHNTSGGGSSQVFTTREEAEEEYLSAMARSRNFWEDKVAWKENGDRTLPTYITHKQTGKGVKVTEGGGMCVRAGHRHYVPSYLGFRPNNYNDCKGFGGAKWYWRFLDENGQPTGEVFKTDSLFTQGDIPEDFRDRLPDNAVFTDEQGVPR